MLARSPLLAALSESAPVLAPDGTMVLARQPGRELG
jgi:hypothetical protein